jgi:transmembrane sensor
MSGEPQDNEAATQAEAIRIRAADWLMERRVSEDWTADNQAVLDAWLAESPLHLLAYWRLDAAWSRTDRLVALRGSPASGVVENEKRSRPAMIAVAAITIFAVLAVAGAQYLSRPAATIYETSVGGRKTIALSDGSRVELNTDSVLRVSTNADRRTVILDKGEAYFEIKHNAAHPFTAIVGNHRVTDIGTKFLVRHDGHNMEVSVVEGSVSFGEADARMQTQPLLLTSGDSVVATASSMIVTKKTPQKLANELSWRSGVLVFKYTTLADAVAEFNRYNREKLIVADSAVARLTVVGTFPTNGVSEFTDAAQAIFGLRIEKRGNDVVISR